MGVQRYLGGTSCSTTSQFINLVHYERSVHICKFCSCIDTIIILQHVGSSELGSILLNAPDLINTTSLYDLKDFPLLLPPGITLSTIGHFAKAACRWGRWKMNEYVTRRAWICVIPGLSCANPGSMVCLRNLEIALIYILTQSTRVSRNVHYNEGTKIISTTQSLAEPLSVHTDKLR